MMMSKLKLKSNLKSEKWIAKMKCKMNNHQKINNNKLQKSNYSPKL